MVRMEDVLGGAGARAGRGGRANILYSMRRRRLWLSAGGLHMDACVTLRLTRTASRDEPRIKADHDEESEKKRSPPHHANQRRAHSPVLRGVVRNLVWEGINYTVAELRRTVATISNLSWVRKQTHKNF